MFVTLLLSKFSNIKKNNKLYFYFKHVKFTLLKVKVNLLRGMLVNLLLSKFSNIPNKLKLLLLQIYLT